MKDLRKSDKFVDEVMKLAERLVPYCEFDMVTIVSTYMKKEGLINKELSTDGTIGRNGEISVSVDTETDMFREKKFLVIRYEANCKGVIVPGEKRVEIKNWLELCA